MKPIAASPRPGNDGTAASFAKRNRSERDAWGQIALELDEPMRLDAYEALVSQLGRENIGKLAKEMSR